MKYLKYLTLGLLSSIIISTTSCTDDFLETASSESVSSVSISNTVGGLYIALNGIHRKMVSQDLGLQGMGAVPGFMFTSDAHGDDLTWAANTWAQGHLNWQINKNNVSAYNVGIWRTYYQFILNVNMILEALDKVTITNASDGNLAKYIKGECLSIRAWSHFMLVQYYAKAYMAGTTNSQLGVPYRVSSSTENMARNTVAEVYTLINKDLDDATTLLAGYVPKAVTHISEKVAWGYKARVALTQQNYEKAGDYAAKAITLATTEGFKIMQKADLMNGFASITTTTKDALYAAVTLSDQTVYFYSYFAYMSWNFNASAIKGGVKCISQTTYDKMSTTDLRRAWWDPAGTATVPTTAYAKAKYQNRKFTARTAADPVGDVAYMRLSEMYLIAAEGYARANKNTEAKTYFTTFVAQRDPSYVDKGNTGTALAEEVMIHRRVELWGEGFRWFDLKRLNLACKRDGNNFSVTFCGFLNKEQSQEDGWYYEIPKIETDNNSLMVKNY